MNLNDTILLATRNQGKIKELGRLLTPFRLNVVGLDKFPDLAELEETGASFEENAILKARYASANSGLVAVADDSGLMVEALDGAPGVKSARFSQGEAACTPELSMDERNNEKLLRLLAEVPREERRARFYSAIAAVAPSGQTVTVSGTWEGMITTAAKGENGFGYDPLFLDPEMGLTAAQMSPHEKNQRSHRAKAMLALAELWPGFWAEVTAK